MTGQVEPGDYERAQQEVRAFRSSGDRAALEFKDHGPDNIGGRTRAILIDKNDINHIFAGSVSGGLFESVNRGSTWSKVEGFDGNYGVSSMCQTDDGTIYVATGNSIEQFTGSTQGTGMNGNGVYFSNDNGVTFEHITGTANYSFVNEIVAKENSVLIAGSSGLIEYKNGILSNFTNAPGTCKAVVISNDNQVIVGSFATQRTWVSTDGGGTFTAVYGNGPDEIPAGKGRVEYAISHEKVNGKYYVYASMSESGALHGVFKSEDNGLTWSRTAPANNGVPGAFAPFGSNRQGWFDQVISVVKGDPETCLLGGINIYAKSSSGNWETRSAAGLPDISQLYVHPDQHEMQWDAEGRLWIGNDGGVFFSDDNGYTFRQANRGYNVTQFYRIAASAHGDVAGGTQDNGTPGNYHNNHTYREHKSISGNDGFACDFSFMNRDVVYSTSQFGRIFRTGDRGINTVTIEPQNIPASAGIPMANLGSFYTVLELYENPADFNSKDSVQFVPTRSFQAGEVVQVPSLTSQQFMTHTLQQDVTFQDTLYANPALTITDIIITDTTGDDESFNLYDYDYTFITGTMPVTEGDSLELQQDGVVIGVYGVDSISTQPHYFGTNVLEPGEVYDMGIYDLLENIADWDTVMVQDHYQSWLAFGLGNGAGLWLTRNGLRFSALHDGFLQAGGNINGDVTEMEFSKDGNHLFVGTSTGAFYRLSNLNEIYSPNPDMGAANGNIPDQTIIWQENPDYTTITTFELIANFTGPVTGINVEKGDADHVVVTLGGYGLGERVQASINATQPGVQFNSIAGNLPDMPCLSIVMDRNNPDIIFVGSDFGLWRSETGGDFWEFCETPFGEVPVFDLKQNWRTWDEGCYKPGQIYIGTHGRGIWTTDEYLNLPETQDNLSAVPEISALLLYPNPVRNNAIVAFEAREIGLATARVYSLTGKLVMETPLSINAGENTVSLSVESLAPGTYILNINNGSTSKTTKFIKQ